MGCKGEDLKFFINKYIYQFCGIFIKKFLFRNNRELVYLNNYFDVYFKRFNQVFIIKFKDCKVNKGIYVCI